MSTVLARDYRNKSDEYAKIAGKTRSLKEGSDCRKIARAYRTLAENEDWLDGKPIP